MAENSAENSRNLGSQPQFEVPLTPGDGQERQTEQAIEKRQVSEGAPSKAAPKLPVQIPVNLPQPAQQQQDAAQSGGQSASPASTGLPAKDADLIEKEWVERAKSIVKQTQDDPYKQKNEMSKIKADYIKKRFNKTVPVEDTKKK